MKKSMRELKSSQSDSSSKERIDSRKKFRNKKQRDYDDDNLVLYLMDTNILYYMFCNKHDIYTKLKEHSNEKKINLYIIGKINNEFDYLANKMDEEYDGISNPEKLDEFEKKLKELGTVQYLKSRTDSDFWKKAKEFSETKGKSYTNKKGQGLSVPDCLLLKYYLANTKYELITHDGPLKTAAKEEGGKFRPEMIFDPVSSSTNTNQ